MRDLASRLDQLALIGHHTTLTISSGVAPSPYDGNPRSANMSREESRLHPSHPYTSLVPCGLSMIRTQSVCRQLFTYCGLYLYLHYNLGTFPAWLCSNTMVQITMCCFKEDKGKQSDHSNVCMAHRRFGIRITSRHFGDNLGTILSQLQSCLCTYD